MVEGRPWAATSQWRIYITGEELAICVTLSEKNNQQTFVEQCYNFPSRHLLSSKSTRMHMTHIKWGLTPPRDSSILTKTKNLNQKIFQSVQSQLSATHLTAGKGSWGAAQLLRDLDARSSCWDTASACQALPRHSTSKRVKVKSARTKSHWIKVLQLVCLQLLRYLNICLNFL